MSLEPTHVKRVQQVKQHWWVSLHVNLVLLASTKTMQELRRVKHALLASGTTSPGVPMKRNVCGVQKVRIRKWWDFLCFKSATDVRLGNFRTKKAMAMN